MPTNPIQAPAGYVSSHAAAFADAAGAAVVVSNATPLPVSLHSANATPLVGSTTATGILGPFSPLVGRPVMLVLAGSWTGEVRLLRSTDAGASKLPLTVGGSAWGKFSGNCCEAIWEEGENGAQLYLDVALTAGSLAYRVAQ